MTDEQPQVQENPIINRPSISMQKPSLTKFIQLTVGGNPFLVFAKKGQITHMDVLRDFLDERRIHYEERELCGGIIVPKTQGERYDFVGAGVVRPIQGTLAFIDKSSDYGYKLNIPHLNSLREHFPSGLEIRFA